MPKKAKALSALGVKSLSGVGYHAVGTVAGLHLAISGSGTKSWILRIVIGTKRRDVGLGAYPEVSLADAHRKARETKEDVANGIDPIARRKQNRSTVIWTFARCATEYIEMNRAGWKNAKHGQQWENTLKTYVFPVFGDKHVTDISLADVLQVIQSQWTTKNETMNRVRGRIELVLDWAAVRGYRGKENPAVWRGNLDKVLPKPSKVNKSTHHKALDFAGLAPCMNQLLESKSMGAQCLAFAILTAARSGEVRGACWSEINLQSAVWVIPRERMKANREHRVPLSTHAIAVLEKLPRFESTDLVFPSLANKALSDMTLTQQLRRMNVAAVPHGFRSTFGDWSREIGGYSEDLREAALAHVVSDKTQAAYVRGDLFEKRRQMMERWGSFCVSERAPTSQKIHRAS